MDNSNTLGNVKNIDEIKIGFWYSMCCHRDLCEVINTSDIEYIKAQLSYGLDVSIWKNKEKALVEMHTQTNDATDRTEIDKMLADVGKV